MKGRARMRKRTEKRNSRIISAYMRGRSRPYLARSYALAVGTITQILSSPRARSRLKTSYEREERILFRREKAWEMFTDAYSYQQIAKQLHVTESRVRRLVDEKYQEAKANKR